MLYRRSLLAALVAGALAAPGFAADTSTGAIEVSGAFTRATAPSAMAGGAFMTLTSTGEADTLLGFTTPACNRPELHTHIHEDGVMKMRQVESIEVPAGGSAVLEPGGLHLMLIDLNGPLVEGETINVMLMFEHAGEVAVEVPVMAAGAMHAHKM